MHRVADEICSTSGRQLCPSKFAQCMSRQMKQGKSKRNASWLRLYRDTGLTLASWPVCQATQDTAKYPELERMIEEKDSKGSEETMKISFRSVNTFDLWIWFELYRIPGKDDKDLLETVLESWFVIGRLGGFNGMNMQVSQNAGGQASFYRYNADETESSQQALFMNYSELETRGKWCRFWLNMGTADEVAIDILINTLSVFSKENLGIKQLIVGGANPDWPVVSREEQALEDLKNPNTMDTTATPLN